jgi:drug/metabolite transporter (DMT)-like permease
LRYWIEALFMSKKPLIFVIIAASCFGISTPISKLLLKDIAPVELAGLLYFGAFLGLGLFFLLSRARKTTTPKTASLERKDLTWLSGAIVTGGILAPISLMIGLTLVTGFSASLLLNLEGVATVFIAVLVFKENAGKKLWIALVCMTVAGVFLSWNPETGKFNVIGSLLIVLATICWGIDNNLTRKISDKNPVQISMIKGLIAGVVSLSIAFIIGNKITLNIDIVYALLLGAVSYGASLVFFVYALKGLGASRTGAFYSFAPFIGAILSLAIFRDNNVLIIIPAVCLMAAGVWLLVTERHSHTHHHEMMVHSHLHRHDDLHHDHEHAEAITGSHTHEHTHPEITHTHEHFPDTDHRHAH